MSHRNIVQFDSEPPLQITLVATGTVWPEKILAAGEEWRMGAVIDSGPGYTTRLYSMTRPGEKGSLLDKLRGGA